ncbi:MAG: hypothetical protein ABIP94_02040 [Planctomycetota bacterium]
MHSVLLVSCFLPTTWIVDAASGPGTNYIDLPPAIAIAQNGDTILVRAGTYTGFTVSGKALTIRGEGVATTVVWSTTIANVPSGQLFLVSGIAFVPQPFTFAQTLQITGPGNVSLADCRATGGTARDALHLSGATVHAARCRFEGGPSNGGQNGYGGAGARVGPGNLAAMACEFRGGSAAVGSGFAFGGIGLGTGSAAVNLSNCICIGGSAGPSVFGSPQGGDALGASSGTVRVSGGPLALVQGGAAANFGGPVPLQSGVSLNNSGTALVLVHSGVSVLPAMAGVPPTQGAISLGVSPLPFLLVNGATLPSGETAAQQPVAVTFFGLFANSPYAFIVGLQPAISAASPMALGEQLVALPNAGLTFGVLNSGGVFSFTFTPAALMPGFLGVPLFTQAASFDVAAMQVRMSNCDVRLFGL